MRIHILSQAQSPRSQFVFEKLLPVYFDAQFVVIDRKEEATNEYIIDYSNAGKSVHFSIPSTGLLYESTIRGLDIHHFSESPEKHYIFFDQESKCTLRFDVFSAIFYLISRYEEYLPHKKDEHGRFPSTASIAHEHGFLHLPIIDIWLEEFRLIFNDFFNVMLEKKHSFQCSPTIDIDLPWAFKHKSTLTNIAASFRDLLTGRWSIFKSRMGFLLKLHNDPFDCYSYLEEKLKNKDALFFFLMRKEGAYDRTTNPDSSFFHSLIKKIGDSFTVGIHPSYASNTDLNKLTEEKESLEKIQGYSIERSRQHYLKLELPATYRNLLSLGIQSDYSMGYAKAISFRAGTSLPFYWYDLSKEEPTDLRVYPFSIMDVMLKDYLTLDVKTALVSVEKHIEIIKKTDGHFCFIWHNSSFSKAHGWEGWESVFEKMLSLAANTE